MPAVYVHPLMAAKEFGEWLQARMEALPITQAELSRQSGVDEGSLSRYKRGMVTPDPAQIQKLCGPLQGDLDEMMRLAGHSSEEPTEHDGRTIVIRTDNPDVAAVARIVEEFDQEHLTQAMRVLRSLYPRRKD